MNTEYDLKAFQNPDGTWAVRGKATAMEGKKPLTHRDGKTPVFAEVEEATPPGEGGGPKEGQDLMEWALAFAKSRKYKTQLDSMIRRQLNVLGISDGKTPKPVSGKVDL